MKRTLLVVVGSLVVSAVPALAPTSNPDLRTVTETPDLNPGGINEVEFPLLNDSDGPDNETREAQNVRVKPRDAGLPIVPILIVVIVVGGAAGGVLYDRRRE